jgi:hypothetical protein
VGELELEVVDIVPLSEDELVDEVVRDSLVLDVVELLLDLVVVKVELVVVVVVFPDKLGNILAIGVALVSFLPRLPKWNILDSS